MKVHRILPLFGKFFCEGWFIDWFLLYISCWIKQLVFNKLKHQFHLTSHVRLVSIWGQRISMPCCTRRALLASWGAMVFTWTKMFAQKLWMQQDLRVTNPQTKVILLFFVSMICCDWHNNENTYWVFLLIYYNNYILSIFNMCDLRKTGHTGLTTYDDMHPLTNQSSNQSRCGSHFAGAYECQSRGCFQWWVVLQFTC